MNFNKKDIQKAFQILPHQSAGVYKLDNCQKGDFIQLKSDDPYCVANICPHCLAIILSENEEVES